MSIEAGKLFFLFFPGIRRIGIKWKTLRADVCQTKESGRTFGARRFMQTA